jgi:DNA-binding PadR family transcriptional regulator
MTEFTRLTPEQGYRVYAWQRMLYGLKGTELEIFAVVFSYTRSGIADGVGGNRFFIDWTGASEDTVTRCLKNLEKTGLIVGSGSARGKLKKYRVSEAVLQKLAELGIENYPQNTGTIQEEYPQNADKLPAKCGYSESETTRKIRVHHPQNTGTPPANCGYYHPQNAGSNQIIKETIKKQEINESVSNAHTREDELPEIAMRSMQPYGGHEVPTMDEVEAALRNMTVKPREDKISLCAGYFMDKMDKEQWRTRDWRAALVRYAARWVQRDNNTPQRPEKKQAPFCRPGEKYEDSGECPW